MTDTNRTNSNIDVSYLEQRINDIENEVSSIKTTVGSMKTDIALLSKDGHNLNKYFENLDKKVNGLIDLVDLKISSLKADIDNQFEKNTKAMETQFAKHVTNIEFAPVKLIAYGLAGGVLLTVLGAILGRVLVGV